MFSRKREEEAVEQPPGEDETHVAEQEKPQCNLLEKRDVLSIGRTKTTRKG